MKIDVVSDQPTFGFGFYANIENALRTDLVNINERTVQVIGISPDYQISSYNRSYTIRFDVPAVSDAIAIYSRFTNPSYNWTALLPGINSVSNVTFVPRSGVTPLSIVYPPWYVHNNTYISATGTIMHVASSDTTTGVGITSPPPSAGRRSLRNAFFVV